MRVNNDSVFILGV